MSEDIADLLRKVPHTANYRGRTTMLDKHWADVKRERMQAADYIEYLQKLLGMKT